jgi:uncharacterized cupin superfamily protein
MSERPRPPFIISTSEVPEKTDRYPHRDEQFGHSRAIGVNAGLERIGLHVHRLLPGERTSLPHAEEKEEEFVYVVDGVVQAWIDGYLHVMRRGDLCAFPAGTGIAHTFINDGEAEATLLVGGERTKPDNRICYPLNPERRGEMAQGEWWESAARRPRGPHDGKPRAR